MKNLDVLNGHLLDDYYGDENKKFSNADAADINAIAAAIPRGIQGQPDTIFWSAETQYFTTRLNLENNAIDAATKNLADANARATAWATANPVGATVPDDLTKAVADANAALNTLTAARATNMFQSSLDNAKLNLQNAINSDAVKQQQKMAARQEKQQTVAAKKAADEEQKQKNDADYKQKLADIEDKAKKLSDLMSQKAADDANNIMGIPKPIAIGGLALVIVLLLARR